MSQSDKSMSQAVSSYYDAHYGNFQIELYSEIRREAFGEDMAQNSWLTAGEEDQFIDCLYRTSAFQTMDKRIAWLGKLLGLLAEERLNLQLISCTVRICSRACVASTSPMIHSGKRHTTEPCARRKDPRETR